MYKILLIAASLVASLPTFAQKYSNEFLTIGVGARNFGMANSVIASLDDVTAGYYNPAALLNTKKNMEFGLMHSEYFKGIAKYDYLGFSKRLDENSVGGISLIRFGTDDIPNTTQLIDKEGNVVDVNARAPHPKLKEEAERLAKMLPKMVPGRQRGKPVGMKYTLPISFTLE